jgi:hypothetical protein
MNDDFKEITKLASQIFNRRPLFYTSVAAFLIVGCGERAIYDGENARLALEQQNYRNIELIGPDFFSCAKKELFGTRAKATAPTGVDKYVVVCREPFKSANILVLGMR